MGAIRAGPPKVSLSSSGVPLNEVPGRRVAVRRKRPPPPPAVEAVMILSNALSYTSS